MKLLRVKVRIGIAVILCLSLASCGDNNGGSPTAAGIEVTPSQANLTPGETLPLTAVLKNGSGQTVDQATFSWQSLDPAIASVDPVAGIVTGHQIGITTIVATSGAFSGGTVIGVMSPNAGGSNFTLSGTARYEDKPFTLNGFTGNLVPTPIRNTVIKIIAIKGFQEIAAGVTGADGTFQFTGINNTTGNGGIYLQVITQTDPGGPTKIEIRNNLSERALFSVISPPLDDGTGSATFNQDVTAGASGIGGAFNLLDVFSKGSELIQGTCPPPAPPCAPPLLTAYWEPGSTEGSYYESELDAIFILGGGNAAGDQDEYDDAVIAHEYGHFALAHFSHDDSPGGSHTLSDNTQDIRLSWSEGWGNFFAGAVRNDPVYLDTSGNGKNIAVSFHLEDYSSLNTTTLGANALYTTSELAVAGVLWDAFDPAGTTPTESHDPLALGFSPIWQAITGMPNTSPTTIESFWLQFVALHPTSTDTLSNSLQTIFQERKMELLPDGNEDNEGATPLLNNTPQTHTLYRTGPDPTGDEDLIPFSVDPGTYTLETFDLTNGADTYLFITDSTTATDPINNWQNDNRDGKSYSPACGFNSITQKSTCPKNDKTTLSSLIAFTWAGANNTTLYARVKHSPNAPPSSGQFGSYRIRLTKQ